MKVLNLRKFSIDLAKKQKKSVEFVLETNEEKFFFEKFFLYWRSSSQLKLFSRLGQVSRFYFILFLLVLDLFFRRWAKFFLVFLIKEFSRRIKIKILKTKIAFRIFLLFEEFFDDHRAVFLVLDEFFVDFWNVFLFFLDEFLKIIRTFFVLDEFFDKFRNIFLCYRVFFLRLSERFLFS